MLQSCREQVAWFPNLFDPRHVAQQLTKYALVATRHLQLDYDVATLSVDGENVNEAPSNRELNADDAFLIIEVQALFDKT